MAFKLAEGYIDLTVHRRAFNVAMRGVRATLSGVHSALASVARQAKRAFVVAGVYAGLSVKAFTRFERAMVQATAAMGTTQSEFMQLYKLVREQSVGLNLDAALAAEGVKQLGYAGLSAAQAMKVFVPLLRFAKAGMADMGLVTKSTLDVMGAYQMSFERTSEITDLLLKAWTKSRQELGDIAEALSYVGATASTSNLKLREVLTVLWAFAEAGIRGTRAGTTLRRMLMNLKAPSSAMAAEIKKLGVEVYDATTQKMRPFMEIFEDMSDALSNATEQERNYAMKVIFGMRAVEGATIAWRKSAKELRDYSDMLKTAGGTVDKVLNRQMAAAAERLGRVWRKIKNLSITIGDILSPAVLSLGESLGNLIDRMNEWAERNKLSIQEWAELVKNRIMFIKDVLFEFGRWMKEDWVGVMKWSFDAVIGEFKVFGETLKILMGKLFTDLYRNIGVYAERAFAMWSVERTAYATALEREQQLMARGGMATHRAGGYPTEAFKQAQVRARAEARQQVRIQAKMGTFREAYPFIETVSMKNVGERIAAAHKRIMKPIFERIPIEHRNALENFWKELLKADKATREKFENLRNRQWRDKLDEWIRNSEAVWDKLEAEFFGGAGAARGAGKPAVAGMGLQPVAFVGIAEAWRKVAESLTPSKEMRDSKNLAEIKIASAKSAGHLEKIAMATARMAETGVGTYV